MRELNKNATLSLPSRIEWQRKKYNGLIDKCLTIVGCLLSCYVLNTGMVEILNTRLESFYFTNLHLMNAPYFRQDVAVERDSSRIEPKQRGNAQTRERREELDDEDENDLQAAAMNACIDAVDTRVVPVDQRGDTKGPAANPLA